MTPHFQQVLSALSAERAHINAGLGYQVTSARREDQAMVLGIAPLKDRRSSAVDEGLEGCRAVWSGGRGEVLVANPDSGEIVLRWPSGGLPTVGTPIRLYPQDFLTPLIELWSDRDRRGRAIALARRDATVALQPEKDLPDAFSPLRERQRDAVRAALHGAALVIGPPGTGKTYTVGATVAYLLTRFSNSRLLLVGPTNMAVDTALIAADDWLVRLGRGEVAAAMKRVGSRFDTKRYAGRQHLLAPDIYSAAAELTALELDEPPKSAAKVYVAWKEKVERARAALKNDVAAVASSARLVAMTAASALKWFAELRAAERWHFAVCDEASQITAPAAVMVGSLARQAVFAGDPHQLAPIVQSPGREVQAVLARTAFDVIPAAKRVQLNEQSRMAFAICGAVSRTFYGGDLKVCSRARSDAAWRQDRSPWYIGGRELPRIMFEDCGGERQWSPKFNGLIRHASAQAVEAAIGRLFGAYVTEREILVLTPFRAQRALIRSFLGRQSASKEIRVSTVHRAQGSENKIVIFDPVDAGGAFLNSEEGRRLINVAISRAQAHVLVFINQEDLRNPWLKSIHDRARVLWHTRGDFAALLSIAR